MRVTPLIVAACGVAACGNSGPGNSGPSSPDAPGNGFVSTWTVIGGSGSYHCPDSTDPWPNPATVYIVAGTSASAVTSSNPDGNACTLTWSVNGLTATLTTGACSFYTTTVTGGTASLSATGMLTWTLTATTPDPPCTATETITAIRKTG